MHGAHRSSRATRVGRLELGRVNFPQDGASEFGRTAARTPAPSQTPGHFVGPDEPASARGGSASG